MRKRQTTHGGTWNPSDDLERGVDVTTDMVSVHDSQFRIVRANKAFAETIGLDISEILGKKCYQLIHGTSEPPPHCPHKQTMLSKTATGESFFEPHLGAYLVVSVTPIMDLSGDVDRSVHVARDITELKRAEEALQSAYGELETLVERRTEELTRANERLRSEIEERVRAESALRKHEASLLESRDELRRLAERLILREEEERRRVAIELESDFMKRLSRLVLETNTLEDEFRGFDRKIVSRIRSTRKQVVQISTDAHRLAKQLHPAVLEQNGLVEAIREEIARFSRRYRISVEFVSPDIPDDLSGHIAFTLYRIVQEGLSNVAQHARTRKALVSLSRSEGLFRLLIKDNGVGFDPASVSAEKAVGLAGIEERVRLIGGTYVLESADGKGTLITVEVQAESGDNASSGHGEPKLSSRQVDVLRFLAQGRVAKEIATSLNISRKTVEFHKYRIMQLLGVRTVADLIRFAVKHKLVHD